MGEPRDEVTSPDEVSVRPLISPTLLTHSSKRMEPGPEPELVPPERENDDLELELDADVDEDHCTICLQAIADRAVIPTCSHDFCFECVLIWSGKDPFISLHRQTIGIRREKKTPTQNNLDGARSAPKTSATT